MAELRFFNKTFLPTKAENNENISARIDIVNFGPVNADNFAVRFTHLETNRNNTIIINHLEADESIIIRTNFTSPAYGNYSIELDCNNNVSESIESNNYLKFEVINI